MRLPDSEYRPIDGAVVFVTPAYERLARRGKAKGEESWDYNGCDELLRADESFIRIEGAAPLYHGAWPVCKYEQGSVFDVSFETPEIYNAFVARLRRLRDKKYRVIDQTLDAIDKAQQSKPSSSD